MQLQLERGRLWEWRRAPAAQARDGGGRTEKKVVCVWAPAADLENLNQVKELAVNVTDDGDGSADVDDIALAHQQLLGLGAYCLNDGLGQELFFV